MKIAYLLAVAAILTSSAAHAAKPCGELKEEISKKVEARGARGFTLDIVTAADVGDKKVVGSCDGGTKKIVYEKK